ncbi:methyltransferase family protein, partial [Hyalangium sp.]|uniref:methyltransferase family protein n=1 Tax=Hyalangium sp. TaxID=2028555 RepID=UPI002D395590
MTTPPSQQPAPVVLTEASGIANAFNPALPPPALLINLVGAGMVMPRCVYVAAKLGLADLLAKGPLEVEELARRTQSDKNALMRVMCTLESMGIFARDGQASTFRNTPLSEFLRADVPGSARPWVLFAGSEWMWDLFGKMPGVVKSGVNVFDDQYKTPMFEWIAKHPPASQEFNNGMAAMSDVSSMMVVQALDLSGV